MIDLVFVTGNSHKRAEVQSMMGEGFIINDLKTIGWNKDIVEHGSTFDENAFIKVQAVHSETGINCFADDSGLVVPALNGEPGIFSARYAGKMASDTENYEKLLVKMTDISDRRAYFHSTICLIFNEVVYYFHGQCHGKLLCEPIGNNGFGYDPIFMPEGQTRSFAEMEDTEKSSISHRAVAVQKMKDFLADLLG